MPESRGETVVLLIDNGPKKADRPSWNSFEGTPLSEGSDPRVERAVSEIASIAVAGNRPGNGYIFNAYAVRRVLLGLLKEESDAG